MSVFVGIMTSTIAVAGVAGGIAYYVVGRFMENPLHGIIFKEEENDEDDIGEKDFIEEGAEE